MKNAIYRVFLVFLFTMSLLAVSYGVMGLLPRTLGTDISFAVVTFTITFVGLAFLLRDRPHSDADMEGVRWK
jgi:hypothetical protein